MAVKPRRKINTQALISTQGNLENDKRKLIHYLDSEIELIKDERQQPGWTRWAISGSLAAIGWIILAEFEKSSLSAGIILNFLVVTSLVCDEMTLLFSFIIERPLSSVYSKNSFFITNQIVGNNRATILLTCLRYIAILFLISKFMPPIGSFSVAILYLLNGYQALIYTIILLLSFLKLPLPNAPKAFSSSLNKIVSLVLFLCVLFVIAELSPKMPVSLRPYP